ncbi:hypothetical protein F0562_033783 [Nyssa sinensis]|uniref:RING-type E3 ubiquitin transferase n=1 Tax=Nyssa sinensis TaxID=561372 RepID=A0A5J5AGV0_9ASTE|nr:hypothetical protein F0562_033783 [Nyssa sinensis]
MASETDVPEPSLLQRLMSSRIRDLSLFLPNILGFTNTTNIINSRQDSTDPDQESPEAPTPRDSRDRIILINPLTRGMVVIEGSSTSPGLDSLLRDLESKDGQPPASKASIEAMQSVEIDEGNEDGECVICLEEWEVGGVAKEMPCKHRFHEKCIEKWLEIHGSCPVCRYKMPFDDEYVNKKSGGGAGGEGRRRREIWAFIPYRSESMSRPSNDNCARKKTLICEDEDKLMSKKMKIVRGP